MERTVIFVSLMPSPLSYNMLMMMQSRCNLLYKNYDALMITPSSLTFHDLNISTNDDKVWYPFPKCKLYLEKVDTDLPKVFTRKPIRCSKRTWSLDYALYSGAFWVYHLLRVERIKQYDFYIKVDLDIMVLQPIDFPSLLVNKTNVMIAHTSILKRFNDCERMSLRIMRDYVNLYKISAKMSSWCSMEKLEYYFYGNFVAYNSSFMTNKDVLDFTEYLYQNRSEGYFQYRWGDQATPPLLLCLFSNHTSRSMKKHTNVLDLSHIRYKYFVHTKTLISLH